MVPKVRHVSVVPNVASWWEGRFFHEALAAPKRARKRAAGSTSFTSSLNQMPPIRPTLFAAQCAQKHTHQAANAEPSRRLQAGPSIQQRPPSPTPCCTPASEQASASRVALGVSVSPPPGPTLPNSTHETLAVVQWKADADAVGPD